MITQLKNLFVAIIVLIASTVTSYAQNMPMQYVSEKTNARCPLEITDRAKLTEVQYVDKEIVFTIELKEPDFSMDQLIDNNVYWKTLLADEYAKSGEGTRQMLSFISNSETTLKLLCVGSQTAKTASCTFSPEELKNILNIDETYYQEMFSIENLVVFINSVAPFPVFDGVYITSASLSGDNIIVENKIDESMHNMDEVMRDPNQFKAYALSGLSSNEGVRFLATLCVQKKMNLFLRMTGSRSEKVCYTVLTAREMEKSLQRLGK